MTTSPPSNYREAKIALTSTTKLQQLRANSREMTTFAESCNDREMQGPWSDKLETADWQQNVHEILRRFMAVVVSSAFRKSLICWVWDDIRQKGPFRGNFCSSPLAVRRGGIGPERPRKGPDRPGKAPISPEKDRFSRKESLILSENLGLKPPFVSPHLDISPFLGFFPAFGTPFLETFSRLFGFDPETRRASPRSTEPLRIIWGYAPVGHINNAQRGTKLLVFTRLPGTRPRFLDLPENR